MSKKKDTKLKKQTEVESYSPQMLKTYREHVVPSMVSRFNYENSMQVPKLLSIALNMGIGDAKTNNKKLESAIKEIELITGQKPIITRAKKAIAGFKIRENMELGLSVTLRGEKMYSFLTKLLFFTFAQIRDFRGLSLRSFDKAGNYTFGLKEQLIFPEIDYDDVEQTQGFTINIVLDHSSPKYNSKSMDKILNGMILFKFLRFPLNDCGYYEKYSSFSEVSQVWDRKKHLKRKRWSQE